MRGLHGVQELHTDTATEALAREICALVALLIQRLVALISYISVKTGDNVNTDFGRNIQWLDVLALESTTYCRLEMKAVSERLTIGAVSK